ncbi:ATP-binding protein [Latilactobacillus sakei]
MGLNFELLKRVKTLTTYCHIHPDVHLVALKDHAEFCPKCAQNNIRHRHNEAVLAGVWQAYRRDFHGVLENDSIMDDFDLKKATFDNYEVEPGSEAELNLKKAKQIAGRYLDRNYQANTIITGLPGVGKSHLAVSMLKGVNDYIKPDASCLFISVNEAMRLIRSSFSNKQSKYTEEYMTSLMGRVNLLVLDDLGSEASFKRESTEASDWVQGVLFGILNKRNRTIITTNLTTKELKAIYNPKLISRMNKGVAKNDGVIKFTNATPDKREVIF